MRGLLSIQILDSFLQNLARKRSELFQTLRDEEVPLVQGVGTSQSLSKRNANGSCLAFESSDLPRVRDFLHDAA